MSETELRQEMKILVCGDLMRTYAAGQVPILSIYTQHSDEAHLKHAMGDVHQAVIEAVNLLRFGPHACPCVHLSSSCKPDNWKLLCEAINKLLAQFRLPDETWGNERVIEDTKNHHIIFEVARSTLPLPEHQQ